MSTSALGSRARLAIVPLLALSLGLISAADTAAHHRPGASYTGTHSGGGAVEVNTSPDNRFVTAYRFADVPCADGSGVLTSAITYSVGGEVITAHATTHDDPAQYLFSATFGASGAASGSWQHRVSGPNECVTDSVTWTATTTAALPGACVDGDDNDGDGKIDFGSDAGCSDLADADEADPPPPPPPPDTTAPSTALSGKRTQKVGTSVSVTVGCGAEACTATARGTLNVPSVRASKRLRLRSATAQVPAGAKATLRLRLPAKVLNATKKALRKGAKVRADISVRTVDQAGNAASKTRVVMLRR
jgi:hypothetical protein